MTEIFRAGIQAVPRGQVEAAQALGMTERSTMRRVVLPQAIRIVIPAIGNEFIAMIKDSALVSFVGAPGALLARAAPSARPTFQSFETLHRSRRSSTGCLTIVFSLFQERLEKRMARERRADMSAVDGRSATRSPRPAALTPRRAPTPIVARRSACEKFFGSQPRPARRATLEVYPRETVCLIGKSGSGKSTLLRCINFLEEPTVGAIEVDGVRVDADPLNARRPRAPRADPPDPAAAPRWCSRSSTCSRT